MVTSPSPCPSPSGRGDPSARPRRDNPVHPKPRHLSHKQQQPEVARMANRQAFAPCQHVLHGLTKCPSMKERIILIATALSIAAASFVQAAEATTKPLYP